MCSLPSPSPLVSLSRFPSYSSRLLLHRNLNPFLGCFPPPRPGNSRTPSIPSYRLRIVAAYAPLQVDSASSANASTAYRRVADCLVFVPKSTKPRALIHFIGGAFVGAVPEVTYSLFIELLTRQDFLVIATPYNVTFEHVLAAQTVQQKFQQCRDELIKGDFSLSGLRPENIAKLPVLSVGHSNGALLQLLIGCTITEDLPIANAVISFNNKPAADAVPYFEQLGPLTAQLAPIVMSSPLAEIAKGLPGDTVRNLLNIASPVLSQYDEESLQSLQNFTNQIPVVLDQISKGVSEFSPSPLENRKAVGSRYNIKDTLLVVLFGDNLPKPRAKAAESMIDTSDGLLVVGSSLTVLSAFRLAMKARERDTPLAIINIGPTRADESASLKIESRSGEILSKVLQFLAK